MAKSKVYVWKDPASRAWPLAVVLWAQIPLCVFAVPFDRLIRSIDNGALRRAISITGIIEFEGLGDLGLFSSQIGGVILTSLWIFRIVANGHVLKPTMKLAPWAAVIWYLIPGANLLFPHGAMLEIWHVSAREGEGSRGRWLISLWWGALVLTTVTFWGSGFVEDPKAYLIYQREAGAAAMALSSYLFLLVIKRITRMQRDTYAARVFA